MGDSLWLQYVPMWVTGQWHETVTPSVVQFPVTHGLDRQRFPGTEPNKLNHAGFDPGVSGWRRLKMEREPGASVLCFVGSNVWSASLLQS